jgi:hypothetical protein
MGDGSTGPQPLAQASRDQKWSEREVRSISEVDLRTMLEDASSLSASTRPGRWEVATRHGGTPWVIVLEPDPDERLLFVVTVYPGFEP